MEAKAVQKYVRTSPRKLREIVPIIFKLSPVEAMERMPFIRKNAATPLSKVLSTAISNAKNLGMDPGSLEFKEIQINEGPHLKRWRAGARGRAKPYSRRMSHIRIVLKLKEGAKLTKESSKKKKAQIETKKVRSSEELKESVKTKVSKQVGVKASDKKISEKQTKVVSKTIRQVQKKGES